jgi:hypothetical protein
LDRKGEHPVSQLADYNGWVHADGYAGFNGLFGNQNKKIPADPRPGFSSQSKRTKGEFSY